MKRYEPKFDSSKVIFNEYKSDKIDSDTAMARFFELKLPLLEMGIINTIADVLKAYIMDSAKGSDFGIIGWVKLVDTCRDMYSSSLYIGDASTKEESFEDFVRHQSERSTRSRKTYSKIQDKPKFWSLVREIERSI